MKIVAHPRRKVAVVHAGPHGLCSAILLAPHHEVVLQDDRAIHVNMINGGHLATEDPQVQAFVGHKDTGLRATKDKREAISGAHSVVITTPTAFVRHTRSIDTWGLTQAIQSTLEINPMATVVIESTVPVGFAQSVAKLLRCRNLVSAPIAARSRWALWDRLTPSALVVGGRAPLARDYAELMLKGPHAQTQVPHLLTGNSEAEAIHLLHQKRLAADKDLPSGEVLAWAKRHSLDLDAVIEGLTLLQGSPGCGDESQRSARASDPALPLAGHPRSVQ